MLASNNADKFEDSVREDELNDAVIFLPAKWAPTGHPINQLDFNKEGNTNLLLCGNNSHTKIRLGKFDANYGLLLEGDGKGNFKYIKQTESGFNIWGDVKSCVQLNQQFYFGINGKNLITYTLAKKNK